MSTNDPESFTPGQRWLIVGVILLLVSIGIIESISFGMEKQLAQALLVAIAIGVPLLLVVMVLAKNERLLRLLVWISARLPGGSRRRPLVDDQPFPIAWERHLRRNVALYEQLTPAEQNQLQGLIREFLEGKEWVGCAGLEINDEIRVTIAAQACLLLLGNIEHDCFASVRSILVYPTTFQAVRHGDTFLDAGTATLGEAWYRGPVILAWAEVLANSRHPEWGRNVVLHEFAHQLDFQGETLEQALSPGWQARRERRNQVLHAEYQALIRASMDGRATLLDQYGATDPHEFLAVATECFFCRPIALQEQHSLLYDVLRDFYSQDPAERLRRSISPHDRKTSRS